MSSALLIRLRPTGPWRFGPSDGAPDRVDSLYRSDRLYSAVCHALADLGLLGEWLETSAASAQPAAIFSSLFPFQGDTHFAPPPETIWPPATASLRSPSQVFLSRVRWRSVKFVPLPVIEALLTGTQIQADQWIADADCGCLLRRDRPQSSPFRIAVRSRATVDRVTGASFDAHKLACVEFEPGAGLWGVVVFAARETAARWRAPLEAAFRLLGDSGFGGQRSAGWGQAPDPELVAGDWPALLMPKLARATAAGNGTLSSLHWLLSLYSPAETDDVNWLEGKYRLVLRNGRVESRTAQSGAFKKPVRMVGEGSVLSARKIVGRAVDVSPDGFAHPVYRSGFALALQLPVVQVIETPPAGQAKEEPTESSAILAEALASAEAEAARLRTEEQVGKPESTLQEVAATGEPAAPAEAETPQATVEQPLVETSAQPEEPEAVAPAPAAIEKQPHSQAEAEPAEAQLAEAQAAAHQVETAAETVDSGQPPIEEEEPGALPADLKATAELPEAEPPSPEMELAPAAPLEAAAEIPEASATPEPPEPLPATSTAAPDTTNLAAPAPETAEAGHTSEPERGPAEPAAPKPEDADHEI